MKLICNGKAMPFIGCVVMFTSDESEIHADGTVTKVGNKHSTFTIILPDTTLIEVDVPGSQTELPEKMILKTRSPKSCLLDLGRVVLNEEPTAELFFNDGSSYRCEARGPRQLTANDIFDMDPDLLQDVIEAQEKLATQKEKIATRAPRFSVHRGVNTWHVVFDGSEVPPLGRDRGMFYVAYLLKHAGQPPIHALELEAKSLVFLRRECGLPMITDQVAGLQVTPDADATIQELNLGKDDAEIESRLARVERMALAVIETSRSAREKQVALEKLQSIREFRRLRFKAGSNPADKAAKRVRVAIDRLCEKLRKHRDSNTQACRAAHGFADVIESHIRVPSAALWPKGGRSKRGHQAGHFQCTKQDGVEWSIL